MKKTLTVSLMLVLIGLCLAAFSGLALAEEDAAAARTARLIARFDADGDGVLSAVEKASLVDWLASRPAFLSRFDADGDGALSADEKAKLSAYVDGEVAKAKSRPAASEDDSE